MRKDNALFGVEDKENLLKYERIIEELKEAVRRSVYRLGQPVPSITAVARELGCSRETVVKAYDILKKEGVLDAHPGKGFFVACEKIADCPKVFLLLNNLTPYMEVLYGAFLGALTGKAVVDVFFHHNRIDLFERFVRDYRRKYTSFIIKPFAHPEIEDTLATLDAERLLILDRREGITPSRSFIAQDFRNDFLTSLREGESRFRKYQKLILVFSPRQTHPAVCVEVFEQFLKESGMQGGVAGSIGAVAVESGTAYITLTDEDLVEVLRGCRNKGLTPGRETGVVSYNDTPLKEFVGGGVTVISADFARMGREAAEFALTRTPVRHTEQARLILRSSL